MKDIQEVLRHKEAELQQLQRELEALRLAARLLADDSDVASEPLKPVATPIAAAPAAGVPRSVPTPSPAPAGGRPAAYSAAWDNAPKQFP